MTPSLQPPYSVLVWACWGAFCLVWIAGAIYNALNAPPRKQGRNWLSSWLVAIALLAAGTVFVPSRLWATFTFDAAPLRIFGATVLVVSTLFTLWARLNLGTMWTSLPVIRQDHQLRTTGPYAITRHPIYTGILGMLTGTALVSGFGIWLFYVLVGVIVLKTKIAAEERLLQEMFGERYREYKQRVPQLVPRI
jgi:protein-S-isoprenylcysteine O-methyltransferase Ste14